MSRFTPYGVQVVPDGGSSVIIGGVTSQDIDTGTEVNAEVTAGAESPQYGELNQTQPGGNFTTHDIASLWQAIGTRGACLTGGADPGFGLYKLKREPCGSLSSGSVHSAARPWHPTGV